MLENGLDFIISSVNHMYKYEKEESINKFCDNDIKKYNCIDCHKHTLIFPNGKYLCLSCNQSHYTDDDIKFCERCGNPFFDFEDSSLCEECLSKE